MSKVSLAEMELFFAKEFPQAKFSLEEFAEKSITIRYKVDESDLRPGGTVSGPTMMSLADCAIYVAILKEIGLVALAVTTSLNINFLRKPVAGKDIVGVCRLLKLGKSLAIGEVSIFSEGESEPVAHSVGTYSIPPNK
ncbi:MAG: PaaI family thioesterase [Pseudohongiellaceae bacterium]